MNIIGEYKKALGSLTTAVTVAIILIVVYFLIRYGIRAYALRNVGLSSGAGDFSNLASQVYETFSSWTSGPSDVDSVSARVSNLSDDDLLKLNDKFVRLYGDKCRGGGIFCSDTTSLLSFVDSYNCLFTCSNHEQLVQRLKSVLL